MARDSEVRRRSEVHIIEADPLGAALDGPAQDPADGLPLLKVRVRNVGDKLVVGITATLRSTLSDKSESPNIDALTPGGDHVFTFRLAPFLTFDDPPSRWGVKFAVSSLEVFVESHGPLGQRVLQIFQYQPDGAKAFYLSRLEIVPNVPGGSSAVTTIAG